MLEPSLRRARNSPPSGASWMVSGPEGPAQGGPGPCPAPSLGGPRWGGRRPRPGQGPPSSATSLPTATTASRFYRIDRAQVSTRRPAPSAAGSGAPVSPVLLGHPPQPGTAVLASHSVRGWAVHRDGADGRREPVCPDRARWVGVGWGRPSRHSCHPSRHGRKGTSGQRPGHLGKRLAVERGWPAGGPAVWRSGYGLGWQERRGEWGRGQGTGRATGPPASCQRSCSQQRLLQVSWPGSPFTTTPATLQGPDSRP